jgi:hypothetical protein
MSHKGSDFKPYEQYLIRLRLWERPQPSSPDCEMPSERKDYTGFQTLKVKHPDQQVKYSAMSACWEGVSASLNAIKKGLYRGSTDSASTYP